MPSIKVTVFQKNINTDVSKSQKEKLISTKSDFLLLGEFFPSTHDNKNLLERSKRKESYLDKILEISEYYKGVILGGSVIREIDGKLYESTPIVQNVNLIDWFDKRVSENDQINCGNGDGIYILSGVRFAVFCGEELSPEYSENFLAKIQEEKVEIVFYLCSSSFIDNYDEELKFFFENSKKYNVQIVKCASSGLIDQKKIISRSLFSTQTGINWKVAPFENDTEIIKTLTLNF